MLIEKDEVYSRERGFLIPGREMARVGGSSDTPLVKPCFTITRLPPFTLQSTELP
jgi:hypothetical protein